MKLITIDYGQTHTQDLNTNQNSFNLDKMAQINLNNYLESLEAKSSSNSVGAILSTSKPKKIICPECRKLKRDYTKGICDVCYNHKYYQKNKEKCKELNKKWKIKNPEKSKGYSKKWRINNIEKARKNEREWYYKNISKVREYCQRPEYKIKRRINYQKNKEYIKKYRTSYYFKNREKILNQQKKYQQSLKGKKSHSERNKIYRQKNREKILLKMKEIGKTPEYKKKKKEYREKNKIKLKQYFKDYYKRNKKIKMIYLNNYFKKRRISDKNFAVQEKLRRAVCSAFRLYTKTGKILTSKKYGIDYKAIIKHLKPFPKNIKNYELHHIKPLHTFNLNNHKEVKEAFKPENHILLTKQEHRELHNLTKRGDKD